MRLFLIWTIGVLTICTLTKALAQTASMNEINRLLENQNYPAALRHLELQDSTMANLAKMGLCHYKLGSWAQAKQIYELMIRRDSSEIGARVQLGQLYFQEANWPKAIRYYRELIQLDSTNATYYKNCGEAHEQAGLLREAFGYWQNAFRLNPTDIPLILNLAEVFLTNKQPEVADSLIQIAHRLDQHNVKVLMYLARVRYVLKNYPDVDWAISRVNSFIDLNPYYRKMWAYALIQLDSIDHSIHLLENLLREDADENTHYYLGLAYERKKDFPVAQFHYQKAIQKAVSTNMSTYYFRSGLVSKEQQLYKDAIQAYREAYRYSKDPVFVFYEAQISDLYYKNKKIALHKYQDYLKLTDAVHPQFIQYAQERSQYLSEYLHQTKSN